MPIAVPSGITVVFGTTATFTSFIFTDPGATLSSRVKALSAIPSPSVSIVGFNAYSNLP